MNPLISSDVVRLLGITRQGVDSARKAGHLAAKKHGRDWMYDPESVEQYARERLGKVGRPRKPIVQ